MFLDALKDFTVPPKPQTNVDSNKTALDSNQKLDQNVPTAWTEEFIKQQTSNFEATLRSILAQQQGKLII